MVEPLCKICEKPIKLDYKTKLLMNFFQMSNGGAHQKCLERQPKSKPSGKSKNDVHSAKKSK